MKGIVYVVVAFLFGALSVASGVSMFRRWQFWALLALSITLVSGANYVSGKTR